MSRDSGFLHLPTPGIVLVCIKFHQEILLINVPLEGQKKAQKEDVLQLGKGGPPRAPPAREAASPGTNSGGCRPPTPLLLLFLFICSIFW